MSVKRAHFKLAIVVCTILYALVIFHIFTRNLVVDTDYPFHLHNIWAASNGFLLNDPFLNGGGHLPLAYGAIPTLTGVLLYPLLGIYTVAALLAVAAPVLWYLSRKVFEYIASKRVAWLSTTILVLNPFTVYLFLSAKLPFLWGICLALGSILLHLRGKNLLASLLGVAAIATHPLVVCLLGASLLLTRDLRGWLKPYSLPLAVFSLQLLFLFQFTPSGLPALLVTYIDRLIFLFLLLLVPLMVKKVESIKRVGPTLGVRCALVVSVLAIFSAGVVCARPPMLDNPEAYGELPEGVVENLKLGQVRYASDGSALYILPKLGVKFSNAGQEVFEVENVDAAAYAKRLKGENALYILVYGQPKENFVGGWYMEEARIREMGFPLIHSADNVRLYYVDPKIVETFLGRKG